MANDNKLVNLADLKEAFDSLKVNASQSAAGLMSADDKAKLDEAASYKVIGPQSVVSVSDAIAAKAGKVLVNIEPVQSGSGDPSPTNVRPISGWTGANVNRTGVNVWDEEWESGDYNDSDGSPHAASSRIRAKNPISCKPTTSYYYVATGIRAQFFYYDINDNFVSTTGWLDGNRVITTPSNCHYMRFYLVGTTSYDSGVGINYPSTDTAYHSYTGTTYPISWQSEAGTVYGGTLDVTTGLLTVTMAEVDLGTLTWIKLDKGGQIAFRSAPAGMKTYSAQQTSYGLSCSNYKFGLSHNGETNLVYNMPDDSFGICYDSSIYFYIKDNAYASGDATAFKTAMSGVQLVYELATPQTYQLTPTQIALLLGDNNVWADTGDITVGYLREDSLGTGEAIADAIKSSDASHGQLVKAAMTKTFNDAIEVTTPTFSTLPKTFAAVGVTPEHELVQDGIAYLSNPSAMGSDWTIATGNDEFTISGTCNDSTYVKLSFCVKQKATATM